MQHGDTATASTRSRARKPTQVATRVLATCDSTTGCLAVPFRLAHVKDRGADGLAWAKVSWPKPAFICITTTIKAKTTTIATIA